MVALVKPAQQLRMVYKLEALCAPVSQQHRHGQSTNYSDLFYRLMAL